MDKRVTKEEMSTLPYIRAIDFDGTLVEDRFPAIGSPNWAVVETLRAMQNLKNSRLILWTCRNGEYLEEAVTYCRDVLGIVFDAVNDNIPEVIAMFNGGTRKIYANEYWDDKAVIINADIYDDSICCESCKTIYRPLSNHQKLVCHFCGTARE